jgi:hypothetical protein
VADRAAARVNVLGGRKSGALSSLELRLEASELDSDDCVAGMTGGGGGEKAVMVVMVVALNWMEFDWVR